MSELKAINAYQLTTNTEDSDVYIHNDEFGCGGDLVECYLKSEADKVIADLEDKLQAANEQIENLINSASRIMLFQDRVYDNTCEELRHQKYKRCLAMSWWCSAELGMLVSTWESKIKHYKKWQKRWMELADEFKPNNSTAQ